MATDGKSYSPDSRIQMSESHRGNRHSPETIEKMRRARRLREERKRIPTVLEDKHKMRNKLPTDRTDTTLHFTILDRVNEQPDGRADVREVKGYLTANTYPDGKLGEIFIQIGKAGSSDSWVDHWCMACSIALQHGAGVDELFGKFVGARFSPSGIVKWVPGVESCTSVVDLVSRHILKRFSTP